MGKKEEIIKRLDAIEELAMDVVNAIHALRQKLDNDDEATENTVPPNPPPPPGGGGG